jgi:polyhydroxyalkanoate synthesis regulator phasin
MTDMLRKAFFLGLGVLASGKDMIEKVVNDMADRGEVTQEEAKKLASSLVERGRREKDELVSMLNSEIKRLLKGSPVASKNELEEIEERLRKIERLLEEERKEQD